MSVKKYGTWGSVFITAGLVVTGVFWWSRDSPYIAAEDAAEIIAASWERNMVFNTADYPDYGWNAGTVTAWVAGGQIRNALEDLRMALYTRETLNDLTYLDADQSVPGDGAKVVEYTSSWISVASTNEEDGVYWRYWYPGSNDNAKCYYFRTLNTRATEFSPPFIDYGAFEYTYAPVAELGRASFEAEGEGLATGQTYFWGHAGSWWYYSGLGEYLYRWQHSPVGHFVGTNVLNDARKVAKAMKRTVWFTLLGDKWNNADDYLVTEVYGHGVTNVNHDGESATPTAEAMVGVAAAKAEYFATTETYANRVPLELGYVSLLGTSTHTEPRTEYSDPILRNYRAYGECLFRRTKIENLTSPYPSPQMIASGVVQRVRIFGVARAPRPAWPIVQYSLKPGTNDTLLLGYTLDNTKPNAYVDETLGTGLHLCDYVDMEGELDESWRGQQLQRSAHPNVVKVSLLLDTGGGGPVTKVPKFDIGADFSATDLELKQSKSWTYGHGATKPPLEQYLETRRELVYFHRIRLYAIIVVVDWDFRHLSD